MALPKEPRQKMVNMMYLVLTALLALNVSSEILNAFKTVNNSITTANKVIAENTNTVNASLKDKLADPKSAEKAKIWEPKAAQASQLVAVVYNQIETLKEELKKEAKWSPKDTLSWNDNLDAATRLFDKRGEGEKLRKSLEDLKKNLLGIDADINKEFANKLPIDLTVPKSQTGNKNPSWTTNYFHMTPAIAATTILSKFQNDIKNSENQIVTYCHNQIGAVAVRFDKYGFVGGLSSSYLMPNEKITIYAGLGATSSAASPQITINGKPVALNPDGLAQTDMVSGGTGAGKAHVVIRFKDQDGLDKVIEKDLPYTVGAPSGVSVSADKMNVLYIGEENPLTITAGVGSEKVNATFTGGGEIRRVGGPKWVVIPKTPGEQSVNVIVDGKATPVKYRVKYLPNPGTFVGGKTGGPMPAADLKANGGIIAKLVESEFDAPFRVISYTVGAVGGKFPTYQTAPNEGNRWNGRAKDIIDQSTPGTAIFFDNIKVAGRDGKVRDLPQMSFNLR